MKIKIDWFGGFFILLSYIMVYMWGNSNSIRPRVIVYQPDYNHVVRIDTCQVIADTTNTTLFLWYDNYIYTADSFWTNSIKE